MKYRFKVDKLIRDRLPEVMRQNNVAMCERVMDNAEYYSRLKDKVLEEADELFRAGTESEHLEELADLLEVIHALGKVYSISIEQIEEKRTQKRDQKGGFEGKIYSPYVEVDSSHENIQYYLDRPERYSEIQ
jgi:predicted house-cleaning noncanonical NTP pyrophosphatase (MazG superfamily)